MILFKSISRILLLIAFADLLAPLFSLSTFSYLLTYDAVGFYSYLETIQASNKDNSALGLGQNKYDSPWLAMEAANVIFSEARARVYIGKIETKAAAATNVNSDGNTSNDEAIARVLQSELDEDGEEALNESLNLGSKTANGNGVSASALADKVRKSWLPPGIEPTLEELPKWNLLREVLDEIEQEIHFGHQDLSK